MAIRVPLFEITKFGNLSFEKRFCELKKGSSLSQLVKFEFCSQDKSDKIIIKIPNLIF